MLNVVAGGVKRWDERSVGVMRVSPGFMHKAHAA